MALRMEYTGQRPHQATKSSAGLDLHAASDESLMPGEVRMVATGTRVAIPEGYFGLLAIRSSLGAKGVSLANGVGIIDSDYRGEIKAAIRNDSDRIFHVGGGERIAQLIIVPFAQVALHRVRALDVTERGDGGFGSTGGR